MHRLLVRGSKEVGLAPGSLVHVGERRTDSTTISVMDYGPDSFEERAGVSVDECGRFRESATVTWIDVNGLHDVAVIEKLGSLFGLHPLTLEDIVNTFQRARFENLDTYLFVILTMIRPAAASGEIVAEQLSLAVGPNFVVSFQEAPGDVFEPVRQRIRSGTGRIRKMGPDYLAYALLDAVVDGYFPVLEHLGEEIQSTEDALVSRPTTETLHAIYRLRNELIFLRRSIWPLRDALAAMAREESSLVQQATQRFVRDVHDHVARVLDTIDSYRELVTGMLDTYLSSVSNRMNEVMKMLTIIATIFIPLTFLAGVYGMNFQYMPELGWRWGYPAVLAVMLVVAVFMVSFFRRKRWL